MYITFTWDPIHTYAYCTRNVYVNNTCYVNLCADLYCIYWTILYHHCHTRKTQVDVIWFCWISIRQSLNNVRASVCTANWEKHVIIAGKMHVLELSQYVITVCVHGTLVCPCRTIIFDVCLTIYNLPGALSFSFLFFPFPLIGGDNNDGSGGGGDDDPVNIHVAMCIISSFARGLCKRAYNHRNSIQLCNYQSVIKVWLTSWDPELTRTTGGVFFKALVSPLHQRNRHRHVD